MKLLTIGLFLIALFPFMILDQQSTLCFLKNVQKVYRKNAGPLKTNYSFVFETLKKIELLNWNRNFVYSPTSLFSLYVIMYYMSPNNMSTLKLPDIFKLPYNEKTNMNFISYANFVERYSNVSSLILMNKFYYDSEIVPLSPVNTTLCYELEKKNFTSNFSNSISFITEWIRNISNNQVNNGIGATINQPINILLFSLMYFKGIWQFPFLKKNVKEDKFMDEKNRVYTVQMMYQRSNYSVWQLSELESKLIEIPYNQKFTIHLLLPINNRPGILSWIVRRIPSNMIESVLEKKKQFEIADLYLPKFTIENTYNVTNLFLDFGIDISKIRVNGLAYKEALYVNDIFHLAKVDVDDSGVLEKEPKPVEFNGTINTIKINAPFIFFISDTSIKSLLFVGLYRRPYFKN